MVTSYHRVYGLDTETDNDGKTAWIVQWAISNGKDEIIGETLKELYDIFIDFLVSKEKECIFYCHNLNYDWPFIQGAVIQIATEYAMKIDAIVRQGNIIKINVNPTEDSPFEAGIEFRDSAKKIQGHLRDVGKLIGIEKLENAVEDFHCGWSKEVPIHDHNDPLWDYVKTDARIVAAAMRQMHKAGDNKATASGDTWKAAKLWMQKIKGTKKLFPRNLLWESYFPKLDLEIDNFCRRAYFGGINISEHKGLCVAIPGRPILHEDIHSSYPSIMKGTDGQKLPFGIPTRVYNMPDLDILWIGAVCIKITLKEGMIPWFTFKDAVDCQIEGMKVGDPVIATNSFHEMVLTSVDLISLNEFYDIEFLDDYPEEYLVFKGKVGIFGDYIDHWYNEKEKCQKGTIDYLRCKLRMNMLYGRFGLAADKYDVEIDFDEDLGDYRFKETNYRQDPDNDAYIPYAVFCTAWARRKLLEGILAADPENVIHCDTDSVIHFGCISDDIGHTDKLGDWDIESRPLKVYEGGFKRYIEIFNEPVQSLKDIHVTCAGVPQRKNKDGVPIGMWVELLDDPEKILHLIDLGQEHYCIHSEWLRKIYLDHDLNPDDVDTMKLLPKKVPGGVILYKTQHQLSDSITWRLRR